MGQIGHNSSISGVASERLRSFVDRIERVEEEIKGLNGDKKEIYSEAKGTGFDVKVLKRVIQLRRMDRSDRIEMEELTDVYMRALEETGTPLANRARVRAHDPETGEVNEEAGDAEAEQEPEADEPQEESAADEAGPAVAEDDTEDPLDMPDFLQRAE